MAPYRLQSLIYSKPLEQHPRSMWAAAKGVTFTQWALFFSGWLAWTCDAMDFFSVPLTVTRLQAQFNKSTQDITTAITLTLVLRPVGALLFGLLSDRYGRKYPLILNLLIIAILELGVGFIQTYPQLLALRALFGIGMGGIWGLSTATALESLPVELRGIASGFLQQGYAIGYLIVAVLNLSLVPAVSVTWRALFWTAAAASLLAAGVRAVLPESEVFLRANEAEKVRASSSSRRTRVFVKETRAALRKHWGAFLYASALMIGLNFLAHGSQDLYPTYLMVSKGLSSHDATVATIIGNCGALAGGIFSGMVSQTIGRRLTLVVLLLCVGAFVPLWILPSSFGPLAAGAFCMQFCVQGALGIIPIQLAETAPPAFRASFPGIAYQIGSTTSAASIQIEAGAAKHLRTTIFKNGQLMQVPDYAKVQGILIGSVAIFTIVVTMLGPEKRGSHFERHKAAFEEGAASDDDTSAEDWPIEEEKSSLEKSQTGITKDLSDVKEDIIMVENV